MILYLTFGEPESWLTLTPLKKLLQSQSVELEVKPMLGSLGNVVTKAKPGEDDPLAEYKARRAAARQKASNRELERKAEMLGVTVEQVDRKIDPTLLSLGLMWVNRNAGDWALYSERAFEKTYIEGADVESLSAIEALLASLDVGVEGFSEFVDKEKSKLINDADNLLEQGLLSAPVFVLDGEIFHGREHLPLIGWILAGRNGAPPV